MKQQKTDKVEITRLVGDERRVASTLQGVSKHWQGSKECFIFFSPHDDDAVIGNGLLIQVALSENVPVYIVVVTDGSMGYCTMEEKQTIAELRRNETYNCYQSLGIPKENIIWLGYPDCQLRMFQGRRPAKHNDPVTVEGYVGLQNSFTYWIRKIQPTQCFVPTSSDLHPDHRIVHEELVISLFHATGSIWPELGKPLEKTPYIHEYGVYCDFPKPPQLQIKSPISMLDKKLKGIAAFRSQKQIGAVIDILKNAGPVEYIRALDFRLYSPREYGILFEERRTIDFPRR